MQGLIIEYNYDGPEEPWRQAIESFLENIKADGQLTGKFSYQVMSEKKSPEKKVHIPKWQDEETLKHLQSQPWFKDFAGKVQGFAGDSLKTRPIKGEFSIG